MAKFRCTLTDFAPNTKYSHLDQHNTAIERCHQNSDIRKSIRDCRQPMRKWVALPVSKNDWIVCQTMADHDPPWRTNWKIGFKTVRAAAIEIKWKLRLFYRNLKIERGVFGCLARFLPFRFPLTLLVGVSLRLRDVVSVFVVLDTLITSSFGRKEKENGNYDAATGRESFELTFSSE